MESEYTFDQLVNIFASDIRSGKIKTKSELYVILKKINNLFQEEKEKYQYHIDRIRSTILKFEDNDKELTRQERDILAFPFEWRIHERINAKIGIGNIKQTRTS